MLYVAKHVLLVPTFGGLPPRVARWCLTRPVHTVIRSSPSSISPSGTVASTGTGGAKEKSLVESSPSVRMPLGNAFLKTGRTKKRTTKRNGKNLTTRSCQLVLHIELFSSRVQTIRLVTLKNVSVSCRLSTLSFPRASDN
jgi:hypothetical protein